MEGQIQGCLASAQELGQQEIEHEPIIFGGGDFQGRHFQIEDW